MRLFGFLKSRPALGDHIVNVIHLCAEEQMRWIDTRWVVAFMKAIQFFWDWTIMQFPTNTTSYRVPVAHTHQSPIVMIRCSQPRPTLISAASINMPPESFLDGMNLVMAETVFHRESLNNATARNSLLGNGRVLATSTHAQAAWIRIRQSIAHSYSVAGYKAIRLSLHAAATSIVFLTDSGFLTTTAVTMAVRDFVKREVHLRRTWGIMGLHQKLPFWCHAAGRFPSSLRLFAFSFTPSLYHNTSVMEVFYS